MSIDRHALLGALGLGDLVTASGGLTKIAAVAAPDPYLYAQAMLDDLCTEAEIMKAALKEQLATGLLPAGANLRKIDGYWDWNTRADEWLAYVIREFGGMSTWDAAAKRRAAIQVRGVFSGWLKAKDLDDLRYLEGPTVTIAFAKASLSQRKLPFDTQRMKNFDWFADRFKELILPDLVSGGEVKLDEIMAAVPVHLRNSDPTGRGQTFDDFVREQRTNGRG